MEARRGAGDERQKREVFSRQAHLALLLTHHIDAPSPQVVVVSVRLLPTVAPPHRWLHAKARVGETPVWHVGMYVLSMMWWIGIVVVMVPAWQWLLPT